MLASTLAQLAGLRIRPYAPRVLFAISSAIFRALAETVVPETLQILTNDRYFLTAVSLSPLKNQWSGGMV